VPCGSSRRAHPHGDHASRLIRLGHVQRRKRGRRRHLVLPVLPRWRVHLAERGDDLFPDHDLWPCQRHQLHGLARAVSAAGAGATSTNTETATPYTYPDAVNAATIYANAENGQVAVSWTVPGDEGSGDHRGPSERVQLRHWWDPGGQHLHPRRPISLSATPRRAASPASPTARRIGSRVPVGERCCCECPLNASHRGHAEHGPRRTERSHRDAGATALADADW